MNRLLSPTISKFAVAFLAVLLPTVALAGPPLVCHPFHIGDYASLPFQGPGWDRVDSTYNAKRVVQDTLALLRADTPVIVRMETLRRATLYVRSDEKLADALVEALDARMNSMAERTDREAALARFDVGYLAETFRQFARANSYGEHWRFSGKEPTVDGYALVRTALSETSDPQMEFAAAVIRADLRNNDYFEHLRKAAENAKPGSILAENLASQFPDDSRALLANARK